jgi:hypothetical protein
MKITSKVSKFSNERKIVEIPKHFRDFFDVGELVSIKKPMYRHGGESTPQYFCIVCNRAHTRHSKIGKEHLCYERKK